MEKELRQQNVALFNIILELINVSSKQSGELYCLRESSNEEMICLIQQKYSISDDVISVTKEELQETDETTLENNIIKFVSKYEKTLFPSEFALLIDTLYECNNTSLDILKRNKEKFQFSKQQNKILDDKMKECMKDDNDTEEMQYLLSEVEQLKAESVTQTKDIMKLEEEKGVLLDNNTKLEKALQALQSEIHEKAETSEMLNEKANKLVQELESKVDYITELQNEVNSLKDKLNPNPELEDLVTKLTDELDSYSSENNNLDEKLRRSEKSIVEKDELLNQTKSQLDLKVQECLDKTNEILKLQNRLTEVTRMSASNDHQNEMEMVEENKRLRMENTELKSRYSELEKTLQTTKDCVLVEMNETKKSNMRLSEQITELLDKMKHNENVGKENEIFKNEINELKNSNTLLEKSKNEMSGRIKILEESVNKMKEERLSSGSGFTSENSENEGEGVDDPRVEKEQLENERTKALEVLTNELNMLDEENRRLKLRIGELVNNKENYESTEVNPNVLLEENNALKKMSEGLNQKIGELMKSVDEKEQELLKMREGSEAILSNETELKVQLEKLQEHYEELEKENSELQHAKKEGVDSMDTLERNEQCEGESSNVERENKELIAKIEELNVLLSNAQKLNEEYTKEVQTLQNENEKQREVIRNMEDQKKRREVEIEEKEDVENQERKERETQMNMLENEIAELRRENTNLHVTVDKLSERQLEQHAETVTSIATEMTSTRSSVSNLTRDSNDKIAVPQIELESPQENETHKKELQLNVEENKKTDDSAKHHHKAAKTHQKSPSDSKETAQSKDKLMATQKTLPKTFQRISQIESPRKPMEQTKEPTPLPKRTGIKDRLAFFEKMSQ
ncbi:hypothetical protein EIN_370140 [Entamoeba invadens IP1]|uniref:Uncharacterized protein n=1 Tax=Entamoeba invadens IP1 TaxID=370355 RepID=A0A0A1UGI1_ENTIV|nr:hypothetical protein EIN_370140 [Entamoeba invadens IP1]ELP92672.1 hypothetical protein EIN_370140 [Entamoeba invadens IP1]|eukprot:XP_004259443.1 hypothetical protein EIN_370140 [Entamoeba invadens IP1]